jgi:hypothetical protein
MPFEIFSRKVKWKGTPSVTFTKLGRFAFNKAATARFEKDAVENVLLLWDQDNRLVGVRPITKKDPRAYKLHMGKKGNGSGFSATTFLQHIGYDYSESRSMTAKWDDGDEMYLIEVPGEYLRANGSDSGTTEQSQAVVLKRRRNTQ